MNYCHTIAQLNRYIGDIEQEEQRQFALQTIREDVERELSTGGCRYYCPSKQDYVVATWGDVQDRVVMKDAFQTLLDWYEDTDSEDTKLRLSKAYHRMLERTKDEVVEEIATLIFYHGGEM